MKFFFKFFLATAALSLMQFANSYAETINKVQAKGNKRVSVESIVVFGDIEIGANYEQKDVSLLIKKLYETNFFSNISVNIKDGILTVSVTENPVVNLIRFEGTNSKKSEDQLREFLAMTEKSSYIKSYVKSDINLIKEFYRQQGFYFVKIDLQVEKLEKNRVNLVYYLEKGDKAKISKIYFLGDKKVRSKTLRNVVTSQENKFWKFVSRNVYLNKGRIDLDKRLLKNYYRNIGYYEVDISSSNVEYSNGEGFVLTYTINAGKRYRFGKMFLDVNKALDASAFLSLEENFSELTGEYYSQRKLTKLLEKIDKLSEQKELQFINHGVDETLEDDGSVVVKVLIYEGQKFMIERINIVGNNVTNDDVIRSEMLVDEGDPYSVLLVNKSINNIKARNIFGKVEQKLSEGSLPDLKVLEVSVEEKATGEISAGAGVGTNGTQFQFAVQENNWLGKGVSVTTSLNLASESVSGGVTINNPNYNYSGNAVFGQFNLSSVDYSTTSGYESSKTGFSGGTTFEQFENIYLSPQLAFTHEDIEITSKATGTIKKMGGTFTNIDFAYSIINDQRDQRYNTNSGYYTKFTQGVPLYIDNSSFLNGIDFNKYHTFSDDVKGTAKFYGRVVLGVDEDVRITERLHIPVDKIRGFEARRIGPKDGTEFIGGNYASALSLEAQFPNLLPEDTKTDISLFMDAANLWSVDYDSQLDDSNKIRSSVGVVANVFTIVGPLNFTLAKSITKAKTDVTQAFAFRLGTSF